jgi:hypothetical protein
MSNTIGVRKRETMPHSEANDNLEHTSSSQVLSLVADESSKIVLSDRPVFGANLTFREDIGNLVNSIVYPSQIIGWIDYSQLTKLACLNHQQYFAAQHFIRVHQNQLFFSKTVKIHSVNQNLKASKTILTFSICVPRRQASIVNIHN